MCEPDDGVVESNPRIHDAVSLSAPTPPGPNQRSPPTKPTSPSGILLGMSDSALPIDPRAATVWTIGHSSHSPEALLSLLHQQHIEVVVDVRSQPYSQFAPHFC